MSTKRPRGNNFTKEEEHLLIGEVAKLKDIIENKETDKVHLSEKIKAWNTVLTNFNAVNYMARSLDQLKVKYDNLKMKARKFAANQNYTKGTGGGPPNSMNDSILDAVLCIMNKKTVVGLPFQFDSDAIRNKQWDNVPVSNPPKRIFVSSPTCEIVDNDVDITNPPNRIYMGPSTSTFVADDVDITNPPKMIYMGPSTSTFVADDVDIAIPPNRIFVDSSTSTFVADTLDLTEFTPSEELQPKETNTSVGDKNWSRYTPKKLKTPVSKKLRQKNVDKSLKEEYYKNKIKLLDDALSLQRQGYALQNEGYAIQNQAFAAQREAFAAQREAFAAQKEGFELQNEILKRQIKLLDIQLEKKLTNE